MDRELELELAQTKLALVETECKNQDLTHQFTVTQVPEVPLSPNFDFFLKPKQDFKGSSSGPQSNTWLSKTLSSIKEVAGENSSIVAFLCVELLLIHPLRIQRKHNENARKHEKVQLRTSNWQQGKIITI